MEQSIDIAKIKTKFWDQKKEEIIAILLKKHLKLFTKFLISLKSDN